MLGTTSRLASRRLLVALAIALPMMAGCGQQQNASDVGPPITIALGGCGARGQAPDLIGTQPPNWRAAEWINSDPLRLEDLRGKVVLVRWFMEPWCPECSATAPALREFDDVYRGAGLAVIGMFHNSDATLDKVREIVQRNYRYGFPVAIDRETATRCEWTLGGDDCGYSNPYRSVTLLLDRRGVVQHVHHEGRYVKGDGAYQAMRSQIERLLMDQPRFDELFDRSKAGSLTESEFTEIESLAKAQERVAFIRAGLDPTSFDDVAKADESDRPPADAIGD